MQNHEVENFCKNCTLRLNCSLLDQAPNVRNYICSIIDDPHFFEVEAKEPVTKDELIEFIQQHTQ